MQRQRAAATTPSAFARVSSLVLVSVLVLLVLSWSTVAVGTPLGTYAEREHERLHQQNLYRQELCALCRQARSWSVSDWRSFADLCSNHCGISAEDAKSGRLEASKRSVYGAHSRSYSEILAACCLSADEDSRSCCTSLLGEPSYY